MTGNNSGTYNFILKMKKYLILSIIYFTLIKSNIFKIIRYAIFLIFLISLLFILVKKKKKLKWKKFHDWYKVN